MRGREYPEHPPFNGAGVSGDREWLTFDGACRLADKIRAAWAKKGIVVETRIVRPEGFRDFFVRTPGLVNGLPVRQPKAEVAQ